MKLDNADIDDMFSKMSESVSEVDGSEAVK